MNDTLKREVIKLTEDELYGVIQEVDQISIPMDAMVRKICKKVNIDDTLFNFYLVIASIAIELKNRRMPTRSLDEAKEAMECFLTEDYMKNNNLIDAIKHLRSLRGIGLGDSKYMIENYITQKNWKWG